MMTTTSYILLILICILFIWIIRLHIRIKRFTRGAHGASLEKTIGLIMRDIERVRHDHIDLKNEQEVLKRKQAKAIRSIETVRFNPFKDQGSNQSFATALVNDEKNGLVISTLFARDRMSVFAKPIIDGKSEYELTVEEKQVLEKTLL